MKTGVGVEISVQMDKALIPKMDTLRLVQYLRSKGLNTDKAFQLYDCPMKVYAQEFRGTALPDKVIGVLKTVIGVVPITEKWKRLED